MGAYSMIEKGIIAAFSAGVAIIMGFFWFVQRGHKEGIKEAKDLAADAHNRITAQSEKNNEKFARRDDVLQMEDRIVSAVNTAIGDLKKDLRAINNNANGGE